MLWFSLEIFLWDPVPETGLIGSVGCQEKKFGSYVPLCFHLAVRVSGGGVAFEWVS